MKAYLFIHTSFYHGRSQSAISPVTWNGATKEVLEIAASFVADQSWGTSLEVYLLEKLPSSLKGLYLEKCNFVNSDFINLFKSFNYNKNILNNLEVISLAGNNITRADFTVISTKSIYQSLEEINLRKNKLYKIIYNPDNFPKVKFINFSKNNLNRSYFREFGKILSLESANGFLFEQDLCENYYKNTEKNNSKINNS